TYQIRLVRKRDASMLGRESMPNLIGTTEDDSLSWFRQQCGFGRGQGKLVRQALEQIRRSRFRLSHQSHHCSEVWRRWRIGLEQNALKFARCRLVHEQVALIVRIQPGIDRDWLARAHIV